MTAARHRFDVVSTQDIYLGRVVALRADMDGMSDRQLAALETATEALGTLVDVLQQAPRPAHAR